MATDTLHPGEVLDNGKSLRSADGRFWLVMQPDGNLVVYCYTAQSTRIPLWDSDTVGSGGGSRELLMHEQGYIQLTGTGWYRPIRAFFPAGSIRPGGTPGSRLVMQDDGNLVIYAPDNQPTWASDTVQPSRDKQLIPPNTLVIAVDNGQIDPLVDRELVNNTGERVAVRDGRSYVDLQPDERVSISETGQLAISASKLIVDEEGRILETSDALADVPLPDGREIFIHRDSHGGYTLT